MPENLRNAQVDPPKVFVVTPTGSIKHVSYGSGINGMVLIEDGRPRVRGIYRDQGFELLSDLYRAENKTKHYAEYQRFIVEASAGRVDPESFPDELLPEEVLRRRKAPRKPTDRPKFVAVIEDVKPIKGR